MNIFGLPPKVVVVLHGSPCALVEYWLAAGFVVHDVLKVECVRSSRSYARYPVHAFHLPGKGKAAVVGVMVRES
jgi:hypothetical protein